MSDWVRVAALEDIDEEDILRFDHGGRTYAVYRLGVTAFASDGLCTHEHAYLCDGLLMEHVVECPKHNGRFDIRDGRPLGAPVCVALKTYPTRIVDGVVFVQI